MVTIYNYKRKVSLRLYFEIISAEAAVIALFCRTRGCVVEVSFVSGNHAGRDFRDSSPVRPCFEGR